MEEEHRLTKERLRKMEELRSLGINPYPYSFPQKDHAAEILTKHRNLKPESKTKNRVQLAGRIMTMRRMGKATFLHLQDQTGRIQLYFREDDVGKEPYHLLKKIDLGDIIGAQGTVFSTKTGEVSVYVKEFQLLTKSLRPLPDKYHGLQDKELRYRERYLDLIMNPDNKQIFLTRTAVMDAVREFMKSNGYIEVSTPILQPIYGGASARPFVSKLNALDMKVYMRISNELYLKRLIVGGFEKVFEFSIDFRNEGVDRSHNPEFTLFEAMTAYTDYKDGMKLVEDLTEHAVRHVKGTAKLEYQGVTVDFKTPWQKISVREAVKKFADVDIEKTNDTELKKIVAQNKIELKEGFSRGAAILALLEEFCEKHFVQPTILYDYPIETSPLAKRKRDDPRYAERFEQYINGFEVGNNYSELNDPKVLAENWKKQEQALKKGDEEAQRMDKDFIKALEVGMPPTCGISVAIDRLVMLLTNQASIRDVILFPTLRPKEWAQPT